MRAVWSALVTAEADLETVWLVLSGRTYAARRFCARCAPTERLWAVGCAGCGQDADGPDRGAGRRDAAGDADDVGAYERAVSYLQRHGWNRAPDGGLRCAACR